MTNLELILNMLAEATTTKITQGRDSQKFVDLKKDAQDGGGIAGNARKDIEVQSGTKVITPQSHTKKLK